ncbi:MAG TPA: VPDSG-CTERM sorting domain-containing protein [Verrucomicrobiota bacterium]|nr:hypothetical protein [Verrucomicrobiales bacterium]HRI12180.1 VPDSG-CTERM sorting domain-containing protein [Verrucomicrobiota bacterium]
MNYPSYVTRSAALVAAVSSLAFLQDAKAIQFDISSVPGSGIRFTGLPAGHAEITFDLGFSGHMFQIDNVVGGTGSATGYEGNITGIFDMGPVTTVTLVPLVETAPVAGTGTFSIFDGVDTLTATVAWVEATSLKTIISIATLGVTGNLTSVSYSGSDPDLLAFVAGIDETAVLSFTFPPPGKSLAELTAPGSRATTYSGNVVSTPVNVPDSGATLILLGAGLCGLSLIPRRFAAK